MIVILCPNMLSINENVQNVLRKYVNSAVWGRNTL